MGRWGEPLDVMEIQELTDWPDELREQARTLYESSFPIEELRDFDGLFDREAALLVARDGDALLGFSVFRYLAEASLGYLWYICVDQSTRGQGIGRQLYQRTLDSLGKNGNCLKGLIFEVERLDSESHPVYGDPIRRVKFYERLGARLILGYDYWQPPIPPHGPVALQLMFHPIGCMPSDDLARIVQDFLRLGQGVEKQVEAAGLRLG